jgi:hypothetical protein
MSRQLYREIAIAGGNHRSKQLLKRLERRRRFGNGAYASGCGFGHAKKPRRTPAYSGVIATLPQSEKVLEGDPCGELAAMFNDSSLH